MKLSYQDLGHGICCIDSFYYRPNLDGFYLVQQGDEAAVIDSGTSHATPALLELLGRRGLTPEQVKYVIPTHVHLDHAGGTGKLIAACPNAQMVVHPRGAQHMNHPEKIIAGTIAIYGEEAFKAHYGSIIPVPEERTLQADDASRYHSPTGRCAASIPRVMPVTISAYGMNRAKACLPATPSACPTGSWIPNRGPS